MVWQSPNDKTLASSKVAIITMAQVQIAHFGCLSLLIYLFCVHVLPAWGWLSWQPVVMVPVAGVAFCCFSLRHSLLILKMSQERLSCFAVGSGFAGVALKNKPWVINQLRVDMSHYNTQSVFFWLAGLVVQYIYLHENTCIFTFLRMSLPFPKYITTSFELCHMKLLHIFGIITIQLRLGFPFTNRKWYFLYFLTKLYLSLCWWQHFCSHFSWEGFENK